MIIRVYLSHFSLGKSHFNSYDEVMNSLKDLSLNKAKFDYPESSCVIDSNLFELDYYGLTLKQQINNFSNNDPMVYGNALNLVYSNYFGSCEFDSLKDEHGEWLMSDRLCRYYAYTPTITFNKMESLNSIANFLLQYDLTLGEFPVSIDSYFRKLLARYKNLVFHEDCLGTMNRFPGDFCNFTISFTKCLSALDSISPTDECDTNVIVSHIQTLTPYSCTSEGKSRPELSFSFLSGALDDNGDPIYQTLNCEFHLKPSNSNKVGDSKFYQNRIYFGFLPNGDKRTIAIASIGPHL